MFRRLPRILVTIALACSVGLHWSLLQSVAWTTMLVGNLKSLSLSQAVVRTFDGKHPCALCKEIAKGKRSEKKSEFPLQLKKFEFLTAQAQFIFTAPTHFWLFVAEGYCPKSVPFAPPTPPPRRALI